MKQNLPKLILNNIMQLCIVTLIWKPVSQLPNALKLYIITHTSYKCDHSISLLVTMIIKTISGLQ